VSIVYEDGFEGINPIWICSYTNKREVLKCVNFG